MKNRTVCMPFFQYAGYVILLIAMDVAMAFLSNDLTARVMAVFLGVVLLCSLAMEAYLCFWCRSGIYDEEGRAFRHAVGRVKETEDIHDKVTIMCAWKELYNIHIREFDDRLRNTPGLEDVYACFSSKRSSAQKACEEGSGEDA